MTRSMQPAPLAFSTAFGFLMITAAAVNADGPGSVPVVLTVVAVVAVLAGLRYRPPATLSVLLVIAVIVLSNPPPLVAALAGLSAAAYLVLRHAAGPSGGCVTTTRPTVAGMVGLTLVGIAATWVPVQLPWLPLLAPPAVIVIFVLVTVPLFRGGTRDG